VLGNVFIKGVEEAVGRQVELSMEFRDEIQPMGRGEMIALKGS